jgi:phenylpropionate dioxygenase-like ring-hydroxylating dioxygenase large terminal subunit
VTVRVQSIAPGTVAAWDDDVVVWRGESGALCAMQRQCPHLDWDLAEATVVGDELVCPGHGWSFDAQGHACKRNLFGRADPKGVVDAFAVREVDGEIRVGS